MKASKIVAPRLVRDELGHPQLLVEKVPYEKDEPWVTAKFLDGSEEEWKDTSDVEVISLSLAQKIALRAVAVGYVALVYAPEPRRKRVYRLAAPCTQKSVDSLVDLGLVRYPRELNRRRPFVVTELGARVAALPL